MKKILLSIGMLLIYGYGSAQQNEWMDSEVNQVNRLPMHADYFAYESETAVSAGLTRSERYLSLNGPWKFFWVRNADQRPTDFFRPDYKVYLSDGTAIEFRNSGQWEEVQNYKGVPTKVMPQAIAKYLDVNYKGVAVTNISYDADDLDSYEVKLASRIELKFDRNGNFLTMEYDD